MSTGNQLAFAAPLKCMPLPDEWPETLLGRFARRMGIRRPWKHHLDQLRPFLPSTMQALEPGEIRYGPDPLPKWALLGPGAQIYYCPACLMESRHIRGRWRIAQLTACTLHRLALKTGLTEPTITTAYHVPGKRLVGEITAEEAWEGATSPSSRAMDHLARVWSPFETRVLAGSSPAETAEALAWALLVERLVDAAALAIRGPDCPAEGVPSHENRAFWLERYELSVQPDLAGVSLFFRSLPLPAHRRAVVVAITRLTNDELKRKTIMSRLPLQTLKDVILATEVASPQRASGALPLAQHRSGHMSFEAAEAHIGCEPGLLYHLIRQRLIRGVQRVKHGRKTYVFIPDDEVRRYRRFLSNYWTSEQMLAFLHIDRSSYRYLRDAELIAPLEMGRWRRYPKASICALLSGLESVSRPVSAARGELFPLMDSWLVKSRRTKAEVAALLREMLDGRIPIYRDLTEEGMGAFKVDHKTLLRLQQVATCIRAHAVRQRWSPGQAELWSCA